jgi:hypothetical protein
LEQSRDKNDKHSEWKSESNSEFNKRPKRVHPPLFDTIIEELNETKQSIFKENNNCSLIFKHR